MLFFAFFAAAGLLAADFPLRAADLLLPLAHTVVTIFLPRLTRVILRQVLLSLALAEGWRAGRP